MDTCYSCKKPIDSSGAKEVLRYEKSLSRSGPKKTLTVQCPHCGKWNSKEVKQ